MPKQTSPAAAQGRPAEDRDIGEAIDVLWNARSLIKLLSLCSEGLSDTYLRDAFSVGILLVGDHLKDVGTILEANLESRRIDEKLEGLRS